MTLTEIINKKGTYLVDVREPFEFNSIHAEGAKNIPLRTIPQRIDEFRAHGNPIVLYCASGNRSGQAARYLQSQGIEEVYNGGGVFQVLGMQN